MNILFKSQHFKIPLNLLILSLIVIIFGILCRFVNLGEKIFWVDEVATAVRVAGYTKQEIVIELITQDIRSVDSLKKYQQLSPDKTFNDTLSALKKSPEHSPLYFILTRCWLEVLGNSITLIRSLSTFLSLLILPCLFWFTQVLFEKFSISLLTITLMSVSPFYVAYAQEARPYSLWVITILLSCVTLLRAIKYNNWQSWGLYIGSLIVGFYTSLLSIFLAIAQGFYLLFIEKNNKNYLKNYVISFAISLIFFSPWIFVIIQNLQLLDDNTTWMRTSLEIPAIIAIWIVSILITFGDLPLVTDINPINILMTLMAVILLIIILYLFYFNHSQLRNLTKIINLYFSQKSLFFVLIILSFMLTFSKLNPLLIVGVTTAFLILILSCYSIYFVIKNNSKKQWLLIICLMFSTALPLLLMDIITQGQSSATPRYLIPLQLGIQLTVAYTLGEKLELNLPKQNQKIFWRSITAIILTLGIVSCGLNINKSPIYQKSRNIHNIPISKIINQTVSPIILTESTEISDLLSLSYHLFPHVKFKIIDQKTNLQTYINQCQPIYIFNPSSNLDTIIKKNLTLKYQQVYKPQLFTLGEISLKLWSISDVNNDCN